MSGAEPWIGSLLLPKLCWEHFSRYPQLELRLFEEDRSGLLQLLAEDGIDMAFLPHDGPVDELFGAEHMSRLIGYIRRNAEELR